ncbi:MAG: class IV adenylate cyclase [Rhodopirellula sp.]|nr:class IV adenylate cyclase [Rhodopirellula sp.]
MTYEVEQKYHLQDLQSFERALKACDAVEELIQHHADTYYNHPCRDFAATNEAFRIRRIGDVPMITYKGPKLPGAIKARREMEWRLDPGDQDGSQTAELLEHLGFKEVATVRKIRRPFRVRDTTGPFGVVIDEVQGLGFFVEVEVMVEKQESIEQARLKIEMIAGQLGLQQPESRSYLRMVLEENLLN